MKLLPVPHANNPWRALADVWSAAIEDQIDLVEAIWDGIANRGVAATPTARHKKQNSQAVCLPILPTRMM
jgi:hypothetical protein